VPTAKPDATVTFPAGVPNSPRIALFTRVTPGRKAIVSSVGVVPAREMRKDLTFDPKSENPIPMAARKSPKTSLNLRKALGASEETSQQLLSLYIPDKDSEGRKFGAQRKWILEAAEILTVIGGGVTIMPAVEGGWLNAEGKTIWEHPVVVYSYVKPGPFLEELPRLRRFLHRLGRDTNQGEVVVEFDGRFYRITKFDAA
jgi:hypothetical protein